ncbi:hypothetical protein [Paenibacillus elgii]|nr:hypothetical protein [Paenibacillus elgii]
MELVLWSILLTLANILGVPIGTFLGQAYGWRAPIRAITAIGFVALLR